MIQFLMLWISSKYKHSYEYNYIVQIILVYDLSIKYSIAE